MKDLFEMAQYDPSANKNGEGMKPSFNYMWVLTIVPSIAPLHLSLGRVLAQWLMNSINWRTIIIVVGI